MGDRAIILIALFVILSIGDILTTLRALKIGGEEANPLPARLFKLFGPLPTMIVLKALGVGFFIYAINATHWLKYPVVGLLLAGSAFVVIHNIRFIARNS